jgi:hypothetical protein
MSIGGADKKQVAVAAAVGAIAVGALVYYFFWGSKKSSKKADSTAVLKTDIPELKFLYKGKVRDVYEVDDKSLLFVASDRLSAFDVVMKNG